MIDGYGRGIIAGGEAASAHQAGQPDSDELQRMAQNAYVCLKSLDYAHLDPESEFIRGFIDGFRTTERGKRIE